MPNIYLEKIALSIEDVRAARKKGDSVERTHRLKGAATGAAIVGSAGAGAGYHFGKKLVNDPIHGAILRATGKSPKKLRGVIAGAGAAIGALQGAAIGDEVSYASARTKKVDAVHKSINKALTKSAAVTKDQVKQRIDHNEGIRNLSRAGGFLAGGISAGAVAGGVGVHKGLKENGGYAAAKDALKNAYARKKSNPEKKIGKGAFLTKLEDIKPSRGVAKHIDRSGIARKVGNTFGRVMARGGLATAAAGAVAGGFAASRAAKNSTDKSDVSYYKKLSSKNG